jgi:hypothetical protein
VKGATFRRTVQWYDADGALVSLTGASAKMDLIEKRTRAVLAQLRSSPGAGITIDTTTNTLTLLLPAATTAELPGERGIYDLLVTTADGTVTRLLSGTIQFEAAVTS